MPEIENKANDQPQRKFRQWAREACKSKTGIHVSWKEVTPLVNALTEAIIEAKPGTSPSQALEYIRVALKLKCGICGFSDPGLLDVLYMAGYVGGFIGLGPLSKISANGECPRCRTSDLLARFSPGKIGIHKDSSVKSPDVPPTSGEDVSD